MAYGTVIFDLDGTLVDSEPDLRASLNRLLTELGRRPLRESEVRSMIGEGAGMLVKRALTATGGADQWRACTDRFLAIYDAQSTALTQPFPGVHAMLAALSGTHRLALCTNKPERPTRQILAHLGWTAHFAVVVGGDTLPQRKPEPHMVQHILDALSVTPGEAVLVGDSPADAGAAQAAGVDFVAVDWGYSRVPVETLPAVQVVSSVTALHALLTAPQ